VLMIVMANHPELIQERIDSFQSRAEARAADVTRKPLHRLLRRHRRKCMNGNW